MIRKNLAITAGIFAGVAALLFLIHARRLIFSPDEGILLEAAQRMLGGQRLYVDFFGYMSPGSYWLQELAFRCFGLSLGTARAVLILDFALECALIFWLVARFGYRTAALATAALFFLFEASNPTLLLPWHKWDSTAISLLGIAVAVEGLWNARHRFWIASAVLITFAAVCTPPVALLVAITAVALLAPSKRRFLAAFTIGALGTAAVVLLVMAKGGYLRPFVEEMLWLKKNYSAANVTPYGTVLGGYPALWASLAGAALPVRLLLLLSATIAAILPPVAALGWGGALLIARRKQALEFRTTVIYLLACMAGYVSSTYPRSDMTHLLHIAPLGYILVALLFAMYLPAAARAAVFSLMLICALLPNIQAARMIASERPVQTPVGDVRASPEDETPVRSLLATVRPGEKMYVHPYEPLFYFLTQTVNPTRFSYLQPGMMTEKDESEALRELMKAPPEWVLYLALDRASYLRVFPSAKNLPYRFERIEAWLHANYAPVDPPLRVDGYQLLARYDWKSNVQSRLGHNPISPGRNGVR